MTIFENPMHPRKTKTEASLPPSFIVRLRLSLPQPPRRMREQRIHQPRLRGQVAAQHRWSAFIAGDVVEQALERGDVAVDRLLEIAVGTVFAGDFVKSFLAGRRVEAFCERLALAALVAGPYFGGGVAIHPAADVERQLFQRIAGGCRWLRRTGARGLAVAAGGVGAAQQGGEPSVASAVGARRRDRRRLGAARGCQAEIGRWQGRGTVAAVAVAAVAHSRRTAPASTGGNQHRLFLALHARAARGDDGQAAAVVGGEGGQFRERLDLVDDDFAHLRGALGGLLRRFPYAPAQFVAGG